MYDTVESTVKFCLQKPNVHNSTLLKNTYEVALIQGVWLLFMNCVHKRHYKYRRVTLPSTPPFWFGLHLSVNDRHSEKLSFSPLVSHVVINSIQNLYLFNLYSRVSILYGVQYTHYTVLLLL